MSRTKKQIRADFRNAVFARDNHCCVMCDQPAVDAHHITDRNEMPGGGSVSENGISLCADCHHLAEQFHGTGTAAEGYSREDLYRKIGSSFTLALEASKQLEE